MQKSGNHQLEVLAVHAFEDNYIWLIHDGTSGIVVDPGDPDAVIRVLDERRLHLAAILVTHHHGDHIAGIPSLAARFRCDVFGPAKEDIAGLTHKVKANDVIRIAQAGLELHVLEIPGHTLGHLAYHCEQRQWLFPGDTLFAAGCGRLFEGSSDQMHRSLQKLMALPDTTQVFCAHEYTLSNLAFALEADPENPDIPHRLLVEKAKRRQGLPTIPTTIGWERRTNPFVRASEASVVRNIVLRRRPANIEPPAIFAALRSWKDEFRSHPNPTPDIAYE
ncbi:MAG TPA: hydroxyacylglutathione hydrolase [Paucimonas sp.]|nr:hydroxyacylglutathione hydrolase [Paucimonas sp.]